MKIQVVDGPLAGQVLDTPAPGEWASVTLQTNWDSPTSELIAYSIRRVNGEWVATWNAR